MHDNATHNSNATHDDAKIVISTMKVMLMMLMVMIYRSVYVLFSRVVQSLWAFSGNLGVNSR